MLPRRLLGALLLLLLIVTGIPILSFLRTLWAAPQPRTTQVPLLDAVAVARQKCYDARTHRCQQSSLAFVRYIASSSSRRL